MGFNNHGAEKIAPRLAQTRKTLTRRFGRLRPILGVNIGKTKTVELSDATDDYLISTRLLARHADYLVVNVSSPNTPGLRQLQAIESSAPRLEPVDNHADDITGPHVPLAGIFAPDLSDAARCVVANLDRERGLASLIARITDISCNTLRASPSELEALGAGRVAGAPLG